MTPDTIDRSGNFGAAFFLLWTHGLGRDWVADGALYRLHLGEWEEMGSGGSTRRNRDQALWRVPSKQGWEWGLIWDLGTSGQDAHDEEGTMLQLAAVTGFVAAVKMEVRGAKPRLLSVQQRPRILRWHPWGTLLCYRPG